MAQKAVVQVHGLREFRRKVVRYDRELGRSLREGLKEVAGEAASAMRAAVPKQSGNWAKKITPGANQSSAYVTWGRKTVPGAGWLEFGGNRRTRSGNTDTSRPHIKDGRFIYPTADRYRDDLTRKAEQVLLTVVRTAGLA